MNWKDSIKKEEKHLNSAIAYYNTIIVNLINKIHQGISEKEILAELEAMTEEMSKELYS